VLTEPLIMTTSYQLPRKPIVRTTEGAGNISPGVQNLSDFHDSVSSFTIKSMPSVPKGNNNNNNSNSNNQNNNSNSNLRRVRSDNLAQRNTSNRRSIFGHYFQDKPRSYSVPHLVRDHGLQQLPPPSLSQHQQEKPQSPSNRRSIKRSSSTSASASSSISITSDFYQPTIIEGNENYHSNNGHNNHHRPADYRAFAPSREQLATSAICNRFRELNKGHQDDYESLLQRRIVIEQSLPPFPSPLRRFCSEVTGLSVGVDSAWFNTSSSLLSNSTNHNCRFSTSNDKSEEMHHYCGGVYSLLTPISVLKSGKYSNADKNDDETAKKNCTKECPIKLGSNDITTKENLAPQNKSGEQKLPTPPSMSSSFNLPRCSLNAATLTNLTTATAISATSVSTIVERDEEKGKNDNSIAISATNFIGECISEEFCDVVDSEDKMEQEEHKEEEKEEQQRLRFDPRVTVTEFEDSIRKWYEEDELNELKGEAIVLAQTYLKEHPAVAKWYQTAKLDLVTKTYRKRALFSLPVFSSSYSNNSTKTDSLQSAVSVASSSSSFQQNEQLTPSSIKKILVVDPHPAIASLFCRSMKSMFPSAELITSLSAEQASRMIKQSFLTNNGSATTEKDNTITGFDIIIVEQNLSPQISSSLNNKNSNNMDTFLNNLDKGPFGLVEMLMKKNRDKSKAASEKKKLSSLMSCELRYGSELIELISSLIEQQDGNDPSLSCLVIGVSVQPDRDATKMRRAGADFVWGKPIPSVGNSLRNKLLSKLLVKRNPSGDN